MESGTKYIKDNEVYQIRKRNEKIDEVRQISLWLIVPFLLLLVLGGYLLFISLGREITGQIAYTVHGETDYQVYLKENEYYIDKFLGPNQQYIASLINIVRAEFDYELEADDDIDVHYEYEIIASAKASEKGDKNKTLFEKSETLKAGSLEKMAQGKIALREGVDIDYSKYNNLMRSFRQDFGVSADCFLDLKMIVKMDGAIKTEDTLAMNIPLSDQTLSITVDTKAVNREESVGTAIQEVYVKNLPLLIVGSVIVVVSLAAIGVVIYLYVTRFGNNWYEEAKYKILKSYDTKIVTLERSFTEPTSIARIGQFIELVDAADNENAPILFMEVVPGEKSYFVVDGTSKTYRYTLTQNYQQERRRNGEGKEF